MTLSNLLPNTTYSFQIRAQSGRSAETSIKTFTTHALPDTTAPANVTDLVAHLISDTNGKDAIKLDWHNPDDPDFTDVRIVRSEEFFPDDPLAGLVVYEGAGESAVDKRVATGHTYYYTAFTRDALGNYSSGAVTYLTIGRSSDGTATTTPGNPLENLPDAPEVPASIAGLKLSDLVFEQGGEKLVIKESAVSVIEVNGSQALTISLPYDKVPEVLKTIAVTIQNEQGEVFTFLLRINTDKTAYTARIGAFGESARYDLVATVLDYKHQKLTKIVGAVVSDLPPIESHESALGAASLLNTVWPYLLLLVLALCGYLLWQRQRHHKDQRENYAPA
jgi:hypothetical protein